MFSSCLKKEEKLFSDLEIMKNDNVLDGYTGIVKFVPSVSTQQKNYQLLSDQIYGDQGVAYSYMSQIGASAESIDLFKKEFTSAKDQYLSFDQWLPVAADNQGMLWLGKVNGYYATLVLLKNVRDVSRLKDLALENSDSQNGSILFVDKVEGLSQALRDLSLSGSYLLGLACCAVMFLLLLWYRRLKSLVILMVPLLSIGLTLLVFALSSTAINLFHIFGLYLILGLGMDYSIFIYQSSAGDKNCLRAVLLSATTSCLSFGLLSLSSTPMVNAFGMTLLLGSVFNLLLAPLVQMVHINRQGLCV